MARKTKKEIVNAVSKIEDLIKTRQILAYSERDLSELTGLTEKTVRKHLKTLKMEIGSRSIEMISQSFVDDLHEMMHDIRHFWRKAKDEKEEKQIMYYTEKMFKAWERFAALLETFGLKPKAIENVNIQADITQRSFNIQIIDDRSKVIDVEE